MGLYLGYLAATWFGGALIGGVLALVSGYMLRLLIGVPGVQVVTEDGAVVRGHTIGVAAPGARGVLHHLRDPMAVGAVVRVCFAVGCGIAAAVHRDAFGAGNGTLWAVTYLACGTSFADFRPWYALPTAAAYLGTLALLR